jgi:hypothetical protein
VPADGDSRERRKVADDRFGGIHELGGQLTVGDDDDADHEGSFRTSK